MTSPGLPPLPSLPFILVPLLGLTLFLLGPTCEAPPPEPEPETQADTDRGEAAPDSGDEAPEPAASAAPDPVDPEPADSSQDGDEPEASTGSPAPGIRSAEGTDPGADGPEQAADSAQPAALPTWNEIVLKPAEGVSEADLLAALGELAVGEVTLRPSIAGWFLATFPATRPPRDQAAQEALSASVAALPAVAEAQPNRRAGPAGR